MKSRTYYDVLGVSRDATTEEITLAKNALAKVYHPDANIHKDIDTTALMQEILEAYRILSDPAKRREYNQEMFGEIPGEAPRVFRTFTLSPEDKAEETSSFVTYWNAANRLNETVRRSVRLMESRPQKKTLSEKLFGKSKRDKANDAERNQQITSLSMQALQYIAVLKLAGIPMQYWQPDAMNWMLIHWGQKQNSDYRLLFSKYDMYVEENKTGADKLRMKTRSRQFHHNLKKLLSYAIEA